MNIYGKAAVRAVELCKSGVAKDPVQAWETAIKEITKSPASRRKGCPKDAFLGLCEDGLVSGICPGKYTNSDKNKSYALQALAALRKNPALANSSAALWDSIERTAKNEQGQMGVVIALWNKGLIT